MPDEKSREIFTIREKTHEVFTSFSDNVTMRPLPSKDLHRAS
jgi:hypothetical protein